ncbi:hypothetical protein PRIPAC_82336, partial [Pristionchus pacificus]|uniref:Uncharacterized protein n=1 Tax=Pristionchus pacificus TaxID=54126 RepID=A0A2A6BYS1_PRIPA
MSEKDIHWVDYLVFVLSIIISLATGIYHAIKSHFFPSGNEKEDYLVGGREMHPLPVALSLLTSFLSGVLMLAVPAEIYVRGPQVWVSFIMGMVASMLTAHLLLPVFHKMKSTCVHEYFIYRYESLLIRRLYSLLFLSYTIIYMGIVIYAPAVALSRVLPLHKMLIMTIFGLTTTVYTCIGGLKAVVWADSIQAVMMYSGVLCLIVRGLMDERVGGIRRVYQLAVETERIDELWRIDPHLAQYNSLWISFGSGTVTWLAAFGVNQLAIQRYVSLPSLSDAQRIIYYTLFPFFLLITLVSSIGFIALAYFYTCDPRETNEVTSEDHIIILFARDILQPTPGLFGLYVSCIMAATLSTLSSGLNSVAAAIYEDWIKQSINGISNSRAAAINKVLTVAAGIVTTGFAFSGDALGGVMKMCVNLLGAFAGPMVAIFFIALFIPRSGKWSTLISFLGSLILISTVYLIGNYERPYDGIHYPTNTTREGCIGVTTNNITLRGTLNYDSHYGRPMSNPQRARSAEFFVTKALRRTAPQKAMRLVDEQCMISPWSYPGIGCFLMIIIAIPLTFFERSDPSKRYLTFYGRNEEWPMTSLEKNINDVTSESSKWTASYEAVCVRIKQIRKGPAQGENLKSLEYSDLGFSTRDQRKTDFDVTSSGANTTTMSKMSMSIAVCERVEQGLAQLKNVDSLKLSELGLSRVLMTMDILIFRAELPLAPDDITSKIFVEYLAFFGTEIYHKNRFHVTSSRANGSSAPKMHMTIVISTLENPDSESFRESTFFSCAKLLQICSILSQTATYIYNNNK